MALRFAELVSASVVAGIIGSYLHASDAAHAWPQKRFIYTEVIAGVSILFSLIWLLPFAGGFIHWPMDLVLSAAWFAAFGLLVNTLGTHGCGGGAFSWGGITHGGVCNRWRASEAFSFISAVCWLASVIVGIWFVSRVENRAVATDNAGRNRRRWFRQSRV
jgi:hypothetical protein